MSLNDKIVLYFINAYRKYFTRDTIDTIVLELLEPLWQLYADRWLDQPFTDQWSTAEQYSIAISPPLWADLTHVCMPRSQGVGQIRSPRDRIQVHSAYWMHHNSAILHYAPNQENVSPRLSPFRATWEVGGDQQGFATSHTGGGGGVLWHHQVTKIWLKSYGN